MVAEILSIIAVCISGVTAICSACVPAILSAKTKREELALKREVEEEKIRREREKEYNAKFETEFEAFYQSHLKVLTDFSNYYVAWQGSTFKTAEIELIKYVRKIAAQFRNNVQVALNDFIDKIENCNSDDNLDEDYKNCVNLILNSFGIKLHENFPDILLPDILKGALKKQFFKLQNLKVDVFGRLIFS